MVCGSAAGFRNRNRIPFRPMGVFLSLIFVCLFVCFAQFVVAIFVYDLRTPHLHRISLRA